MTGEDRKGKNFNEKEEDNRTKISWLESIIIERDDEISWLKDEKKKCTSEVNNLIEKNDKDRTALSKLEEALKLKEVEMESLKEDVEFNKQLKGDMDEKMTDLQTNMQDQLGENARLRTENVNLKNSLFLKTISKIFKRNNY